MLNSGEGWRWGGDKMACNQNILSIIELLKPPNLQKCRPDVHHWDESLCTYKIIATLLQNNDLN